MQLIGWRGWGASLSFARVFISQNYMSALCTVCNRCVLQLSSRGKLRGWTKLANSRQKMSFSATSLRYIVLFLCFLGSGALCVRLLRCVIAWCAVCSLGALCVPLVSCVFVCCAVSLFDIVWFARFSALGSRPLQQLTRVARCRKQSLIPSIFETSRQSSSRNRCPPKLNRSPAV